jgi:hypothetical protein
MVFGLILFQTTVPAQSVAIVKNFDDPEIDSLQSYLNSMGLSSQTIYKDSVTYSSVANFDLLIWDDLGYQGNGIQDSTVSVFLQFYRSGKPIYFIGDDLAYSIINLSPSWDTVWTNLIHLAGVNNYSQDYFVVISNINHPVTNGPYGLVTSFDYSLDIDFAQRTNTGELVLGSTTDSDVLIVFDGPDARTVSQNCLTLQAGSDSSVASRKILFKNAVAWLLKIFTSINRNNVSTPAEYALRQNYPNPFNPSTTINYSVPKSGLVTIKVYDIIGLDVATLVNEEKAPGTYSVNFNARKFASGIYFYRIQAGSFIDTKKMILLK